MLLLRDPFYVPGSAFKMDPANFDPSLSWAVLTDGLTHWMTEWPNERTIPLKGSRIYQTGDLSLNDPFLVFPEALEVTYTGSVGNVVPTLPQDWRAGYSGALGISDKEEASLPLPHPSQQCEISLLWRSCSFTGAKPWLIEEVPWMVSRLLNKMRKAHVSEIHTGPCWETFHTSPSFSSWAQGRHWSSTMVVFPMDALLGLRLLSLCPGAATLIDKI